MRGRYPSGPEFAMKTSGSEQAKTRVRVLLETVAGTCRVQDACEQLGISEQRFDQIRIEAIQAMVDALEPRPAGRPAKALSPAELEVERLKERIAELEAERNAALIRAELSVTLPQMSGVESKKATRLPSRRPPSRKPL